MVDNSSSSDRTTTLSGKLVALAGPELKVGDSAPEFDAVNSSMQSMNLAATGNGVRIFSVVPSLDTPVCDAQTKRFEDEAGKLDGVRIYSVSMDLPFAQQRWCGNFGINKISMLSDHMTGSFGEHYGTLITGLRIESRAIFVVGKDNKLEHVEYVGNVSDHPDYEAALTAARQASAES